jgi:hypothetical protein
MQQHKNDTISNQVGHCFLHYFQRNHGVLGNSSMFAEEEKKK